MSDAVSMPFSRITNMPDPAPGGVSFNQRMLQVAFALAVGGPLVYDNLKQRMDPLLLYAYQGTEGPLDMVTLAAGVPRPGQPISTVAPAGTVYWISTLCVQEGTDMTAFVALVSEADGRVVSQRDRAFPASEKRCGPLPGSIVIPADAAPGPYRVERRMVLTPKQGTPRAETLPHIRFEVAK